MGAITEKMLEEMESVKGLKDRNLDKNGDYLGTVEMSQDISGYRKLEGERRILNYED